MYKKILFRTNIIICIVLIIGFISVSLVSYASNSNTEKDGLEHVSVLTSESICNQIETTFMAPVHVSLTMANDTFLKNYLAAEEEYANDETYLADLQNYLNAYKEEYEYDSVFLVSTKTMRYYHFNGINRIIEPDNPENVWYYEFLEENEEYSLNVDNDEAAENDITVFVNCRITDDNDEIIGVIGVGIRVQHLQQLLQSYDEQYGIKASLVDEDGLVQISSVQPIEKQANLFDNQIYAENADEILASETETNTFWNKDGQNERLTVARYVPSLAWYLVIENDTDVLQSRFERQFIIGLAITGLIAIVILCVINRIIISYNSRLIELAITAEMEYSGLLNEAAEGLYENVFEIDITRDCASGEGTKKYFESLGISGNTPYHKALDVMAQKQIKPEYVNEYLEIFKPENVERAFYDGTRELYYDFMMTDGEDGHRWMRIHARLFYWESDQSIRMITYRQDISEEKEREAMMLRMAQSDSLTGLYNKVATEEQITKILQNQDKKQSHALIMMDIDLFKQINDTYGHAVGDAVIQKFAERLKAQFRTTDICGRVGGDEFVAFLKNFHTMAWLHEQLAQLVMWMNEDILLEDDSCPVSVSVGVAVYPQSGEDFDTLYKHADIALYESKRKGRNCYTVYEDLECSEPKPL